MGTPGAPGSRPPGGLRRYLTDLGRVLVGDGTALDRTEAALIGAPDGETISLYAAIEARHGVLLARVTCVLLSILVQWRHCQKQIAGEPMRPLNYARAAVCLMAPIALLWWLV